MATRTTTRKTNGRKDFDAERAKLKRLLVRGTIDADDFADAVAALATEEATQNAPNAKAGVIVERSSFEKDGTTHQTVRIIPNDRRKPITFGAANWRLIAEHLDAVLEKVAEIEKDQATRN